MVKTPLLKANLLGFIATLLIGGGGIITSSAPASAMYNGASSSSAACEETQKRNQGAFAFPAQEFTGIRESLPVTLWADIHGLDNVAHLYTCHKEMVEWTREHLGIVEETPPVDMGESLVTTLAKYTSHMVGQEDFDANRVTQAIRRICRDTSRNAMPGASYDALYTLRCVHRVAELADRSLFFGASDDHVRAIMTNFCLSLNDMELQDGGTCTQGRFWRLVLPLRTLFSQQHYLACLYAQRYYEDLTEREKGDQFGPLMAHIAKLFNTGVELSRADNEGTRAHLLRELQQPLELEASYPMAWQREGGLSSSGTNFDRFSEEEQLARALEESRRAPSCEQLSEEEQLALALSASQADPSPPRHQEQGSDLELALALSASQEAASGSPSPQGHQESDLYVGLSDEDALALALALSQEEDQR